MSDYMKAHWLFLSFNVFRAGSDGIGGRGIEGPMQILLGGRPVQTQ